MPMTAARQDSLIPTAQYAAARDLKIRDVHVKTVLSKSGIPGVDYCVNPYVGCSHACRYCYATFMKRFTGHLDDWGSFVDVKVNAPLVLEKQLARAARGSVIMSSVTDPYQPIEEECRITRRCLELLVRNKFPVDILTKSPLVLRDLDLLRGSRDIEVGITITTDDESMRQLFEPGAPSIESRFEALKQLHRHDIRTYVFIGPLLPMNPERLAGMIRDYAGFVMIDRMNYVSKTAALYRNRGIERWLERKFVDQVVQKLKRELRETQVHVCQG